MGEIFDKILFLIFVLPALMIKNLWDRLTKDMTKKQKNNVFWYIPYILIIILVILAVILLMKGYRY